MDYMSINPMHPIKPLNNPFWKQNSLPDSSHRTDIQKGKGGGGGEDKKTSN